MKKNQMNLFGIFGFGLIKRCFLAAHTRDWFSAADGIFSLVLNIELSWIPENFPNPLNSWTFRLPRRVEKNSGVKMKISGHQNNKRIMNYLLNALQSRDKSLQKLLYHSSTKTLANSNNFTQFSTILKLKKSHQLKNAENILDFVNFSGKCPRFSLKVVDFRKFI